MLTVKDNQPSLLTAIQDCFEMAIETDFADVKHDEFQTEESGHGRKEIRHYQIITDPSIAHESGLGRLECDWHVPSRVNSERQNQRGSAILYWQSKDHGGDLWKRLAASLANREHVALAIGCDV